MRKNIRNFLIVGLVLLLSLSLPRSAYAENSIGFGEEAVSIIAEGITQTIENGSYVTEVSASAVERMREAYGISSGQLVSASEEINVEMLKQLGFEDDEFVGMTEEEISYLVENMVSTTTIETYYYQDKNGNMQLSTKEAWISSVADQVGTNGNGNIKQDDKTDFRIVSRAVYMSPDSEGGEVGWYKFWAVFTFLGVPRYRMEDAASLYSDDVMWSDNDADYSSSMVYYYEYSGTGETWVETEVKDTEDMYLYAGGLYYTWDLPIDISYGGEIEDEVKYLSISVRGKGRVKTYTQEQGFNLYSRYEHTYSAFSIQPSFSWSITGDPGVSADIGLGITCGVNSYYSNLAITYDPSVLTD